MAASGESPPRQSLLVNLALGAATVVVFLGVAEGLARLTEKPRAPTHREDRIILWDEGWGGQFYQMRSQAVGWPPWQEFNRHGVRDRTHAREKPKGTWRVVCLGDSVTVGPDRRPQDAYPQILQARLDALGPGVEVFNVSLWGWATRQEQIAYQRIAREYQPDQVLLGICLNDFQEMQNNLSRPGPALAALYRRSALVRRLVRAEQRQLAGVEELFAEPDSPGSRASFDQVFAEIRALREEIEADGAELLVTIFPYIAQMVPGAPPPVVQERVRDFCAEEGIRFLDPLPGLGPLGREAFPEGDGGHFNRLGTDRIAQLVVEAGLIPEEAHSIEPLRLALGSEGFDQAAVPALVSLLESEDPRVRTQAAWALGRLGPAASASIDALAKALEDPAESVRLAAAVALGQMGREARRVAPALAMGLEDPRENVRARSADALFKAGPKDEAVPALVAALESPDLYVRGFATWYLGEIGPAASAAVPEVAKVLQRDDAGLRVLAVRTLVKIAPGDPAAVEALAGAMAAPDWDERWRAARVLGRMGAPAVPALVEGLRSPHEAVRHEAARALGRIGPPAAAARPALEQARKYSAPKVRTEAARALERLGDGP